MRVRRRGRLSQHGQSLLDLRVGEIRIESDLATDAVELWRAVVHPDGLNAELAPFFKMSFPPDCTDVTAGWRSGIRQYRSYVMLAGLIPIEYDDVTFAKVVPGQRFEERSSMLLLRSWAHDRSLENIDDGCRLTDTVRFTPRLGPLESVFGLIYRQVFRWRHRQLRRIYGELN